MKKQIIQSEGFKIDSTKIPLIKPPKSMKEYDRWSHEKRILYLYQIKFDELLLDTSITKEEFIIETRKRVLGL